MKTLKIFYSWQSDTSGKFNRFFIEECLKIAIKNLSKEQGISVFFNIERDTKDTMGTPDIVSTIFEKINESDIFLGDVTLINGQTEDRKKTPNPNVLIELGYAAAKLNWDRVICLFNSAFGKIEDLPFDLRTRRILQYCYSDSSESRNKTDLAKALEFALKSIDLEKIIWRKKILEEFKQEPNEIQEIILERGPHWEAKLIGKLLEKKLSEAYEFLGSVEKGQVFSRTIKMGVSEYLRWVETSVRDLLKLIKIAGVSFSKELAIAVGQEGVPADPIAIRKAVNMFYSAIHELVKWEVELRSIKTIDELEKLKNCMLGWVKGILEDFRHLPEEFKKIYEGHHTDGQEILISVKLNAPDSMDECFKQLKHFNENMHLFLNK